MLNLCDKTWALHYSLYCLKYFLFIIITKSDLNQWVPFLLVRCKGKLLLRNKNNYNLHYFNQRLVIHFLSAYYLRNAMKSPNPILTRFVFMIFCKQQSTFDLRFLQTFFLFSIYCLLDTSVTIFFFSLFSPIIRSFYELCRAENKYIPELILSGPGF